MGEPSTDDITAHMDHLLGPCLEDETPMEVDTWIVEAANMLELGSNRLTRLQSENKALKMETERLLKAIGLPAALYGAAAMLSIDPPQAFLQGLRARIDKIARVAEEIRLDRGQM